MGKVVALAGNPNVGKSTVFNQLTGLKQHTGNWTGKTVGSARGSYTYDGCRYEIVDLPGCYSLLSHSGEEEIARDYICFQHPDVVAVICDATCLERSLCLALQVLEAAERVVVCVNLMDEAAKKKIYIRLNQLSEELGVPAVGITARDGWGLKGMFQNIQRQDSESVGRKRVITYPPAIEQAVERLEPAVRWELGEEMDTRWICVRLLENDESLLKSLEHVTKKSLGEESRIGGVLAEVKEELEKSGYTEEMAEDAIAEAYVKKSEEICRRVIQLERQDYDRRDRILDGVFASRLTGIPVMLLLLLFIFWLTICGANIPSQFLMEGFAGLEGALLKGAVNMGIPGSIYEPFIFGVYHVTAWVVSVMLPPMSIFFPLFTLLEDFGYLSRAAYNLDRCFQGCHACGKQALTMCMGFGCNAAGVTGCRIIDSPRERLIAIITNSFVPCNGRFPMILAMISLFIVGTDAGIASSFLSAAALAGVIVLGTGVTLLVSAGLSGTVLKGMPSSFALELPPYRAPQIGKVLVRSVLDRTLFVLARAVISAAPAGLLIWLLANTSAGGESILESCAQILDPFARLMGLDGVILLAFILGLPANEIVLPIAAMLYLSQGTLVNLGEGTRLWEILAQNGWTASTAVSAILFSLMHWPCATTCQTIYKETKSVKWTLVSILVPTVTGVVFCMGFTGLNHLCTKIICL